MKVFQWVIIVVIAMSVCSRQGNTGDIALYSGRGADESCVTATAHMFEWMGLEVELVDAGFINGRPLSGFRIICFPGGNMYQYAQDITGSGKDKIRKFVENGGGYVGICGGAYFTGESVLWQGVELPMSSLRMFPGTTQGPIDAIVPYPDCVMCKVNIINHGHPITQTEPDSAWIMYCYGPKLLPEMDAEVDVLGVYDIGLEPAVVAFEYGGGRVFIIGTHPEFEEDSERDGVVFDDGLDDRGSDWDFMKKAVLWCAGAESTP